MRLASLAASLLILALIWYHIDARAILAAAHGGDPRWLCTGLILIAPLTLMTAWRFGLLSRTTLGIGTSCRLILAASTLNLILPSKMGDLAKAWVLRNRYGFGGQQAIALVVFEKLVDLASLLFWGMAALFVEAQGRLLVLGTVGLGGTLALIVAVVSPWALAPAVLKAVGERLPRQAGRQAVAMAAQWRELTLWFWHDPGRAVLVCAVSLALWAGHLLQIWIFARALAPTVPLTGSMAAATLAILAGLLPLTMAGIGTRDAALVFLYSAWLTPAQGAALGVLATMRYLLPAIAGLPFMHDYWDRRRRARPA